MLTFIILSHDCIKSKEIYKIVNFAKTNNKMSTVNLKKIKNINPKNNLVLLVQNLSEISKEHFTTKEFEFIENKFKEDTNLINVNYLENYVWIYFFKTPNTESYKDFEDYRRAGNEVSIQLVKNKIDNIQIADYQSSKDNTWAFIEGMALGVYSFDKYKLENKRNFTFSIFSKVLDNKSLNELNSIIYTVYKCRHLVNEPYSYLTTLKFAEEIDEMSQESNLKISFFNKIKIATLKMGGLLAVNKGSNEPPFFAVIEWKPQNAINTKPYILIGKGITFDSGGYSVKPAASMEEMKIDMSGGAVTISTLSLAAKNNLPIHVIGLIPATDNKINDKAQLPGDIITMHNGKTVEVLNTDAEGRLILADALSYAQKYDPELVIDIATLTGSAHLALGKYTIFATGKEHRNLMNKLIQSGENVYERLVEFPLWDEYAESLQSKIADLKNVGARHAGAIIASKFLENFTSYPWIHLDIAGPAFFEKSWNYHSSGATGIGVRLLYNFFKNIAYTK